MVVIDLDIINEGSYQSDIGQLDTEAYEVGSLFTLSDLKAWLKQEVKNEKTNL